MLILAWTIMFLSGVFASVEKSCEKGDFCITLKKEVTGEAGLCVVIPCSFETDKLFTPTHIVWYKYKDEKLSFVFSNDRGTEAGFKGRVSLLEPDVGQRNCSIMINDLTESDSGYYHFRVNGNMNGKSDGFSYKTTCDVSVSALKQKPSVTIPSLIEGQQAALTCTAPGLCSGSPPNITWMWRGKGENDSHIIGNTTALKTENLTAFTQRHSSTLTFNPTADHHNTKLNCGVSFTAGPTVQEETLNVTYARKPQISGRTSVKEGHDLNLTCSADSFPPSKIRFSRKFNGNVLLEINASYYITNASRQDAGLYICTAKHLNNTLTEEIYVTVTYESSTVPWMKILIAVFIGGFIFILLSVIAMKHYRKKLNKSGNSVETLEAIAPDDPQSCSGQSVNKAQDEVQEGAVNGALSPELNSVSNNLTYATIDHSKLNRRVEKEENRMENETEYAEIQKQKK